MTSFDKACATALAADTRHITYNYQKNALQKSSVTIDICEYEIQQMDATGTPK